METLASLYSAETYEVANSRKKKVKKNTGKNAKADQKAKQTHSPEIEYDVMPWMP
jgi:hypothetical protein